MGTNKPIRESSGDRQRNWLARGWLAMGLAVSAVLFVRAMPHSPLRGSRPQAKPAAAVTTPASAQDAPASVGVPSGRTETVYVRRLITQPIETIRVGQRVLGINPKRDEVEAFEEPDLKTWRTIEVEQIKPNGKKLYATLLRPLEWIEEELDPETNTIELDLPELGAEGKAKVLRIGPCPPIAPGKGHLVTATFKHEPDGELLTVTVGGEEIGCTANHPFWSEDRQEFVEAGELRQGERVRTRLEQVAAVAAIKPRPPTDWVYNLEVQGEHVYEVGSNGILVHNNCIYLVYVFKDKNGVVRYVGRTATSKTTDAVKALKLRIQKPHEVFEKYAKKLGLTYEVKEVLPNYKSMRGAEEYWYQHYRLKGNSLLNDPLSPPLSRKASKIKKTMEYLRQYWEYRLTQGQ